MRARSQVLALALTTFACTHSSGGTTDATGMTSDSNAVTGATANESNPTDPTGDPTPTTGTPGNCQSPPSGAGEGTFYGADGSGNCSFPASPQNLMVAAMNGADYLGSQACGACVAIEGPKGSVTVRIVDRCPGCAKGDIDLSESAFAMIAEPADGRVPITWSYTDCQQSTPLRYHFKEGSNEFWTAISVRNHNHPVASLEYSQDGGETWVAMSRETYNYFLEPQGLGPGPYTLRVTDIYGHQQVDTDLVFTPDTEVAGGSNLPNCG